MGHLSLLAPAKLNLMLHIVGRRDNGYHELQTIFQLLDVGDQLHFQFESSHVADFELIDDSGIEKTDNLIYKAAQLLLPLANNTLKIHCQLEKLLPMGGGLGGGSSDCATTLLALNSLWQINLSLNKLAEIGLQLGADVPVFVLGQSAWAEGIGEQLTPVELPQKWFVVLKPDIHVSTVQVFTHPQLTRDTPRTTIRTVLHQGGHNDCEKIVCQLYPQINSAIQALGPNAQLTGTGACVFKAFDTEQQANDCLATLSDTWQGFVAKAINRSPVHQQI